MILNKDNVSGTGGYEPSPLPQDVDNLPTYLSDELAKISGVLTGILQGGSMPPQYNMPKRVKKGMIMYFATPIPPSITSEGIWQYRTDSWIKLV